MNKIKTAFIFPGQGAQLVGMGADIAQSFPSAAKVFQKANTILGFDLARLCFEGPSDELNTTTISQPAIFTTSAAGAMVSIIGLDNEKIARLCAEARQGELLEPVNFNCPGQIVLSGAKAPCKRAEQLAPKYDAIKAIPLAVAGAFHTEMMASAAESLTQALADVQITQPDGVKTIANVNAEYYDSAEAIAKGLALQLTTPILWQKCVERLLADGVEEFYEIGPGRVLTGLMRRIERKAEITNLSTAEALNKLLQNTHFKIKDTPCAAASAKSMEDIKCRKKDSQ